MLGNPPGGFWGYWTLDGSGIFYLRPEGGDIREPRPKSPRPVIEYLSFATGKKRRITRPEKEPYYGAPGLAVAPDGSALLYLQITEQSSDIMLVENFR